MIEELVLRLKGELLTYENIEKALKEMGYKKLPDVTIISGYRIDKNSGWVTLSGYFGRIRVTIDNEGKVIG